LARSSLGSVAQNENVSSGHLSPPVSKISHYFHELRGIKNVMLVKSLYPPGKDGSRKFYWTFVAAFLIELKNVSNARLVLNLASQEHVTLVRWVDIYRYEELNPKNPRYHKDQTVPALGIAATITYSVELDGSNVTIKKSLTNPFKRKLVYKPSSEGKKAIKEAKEKFTAEWQQLQLLVKSTGCSSRKLATREIIGLFTDINRFGTREKTFFKNNDLLKQYLSLTNIPNVPLADFPFQKDLPVAIPLGYAPQSPSHPVGFPGLVDKRVLFAGGTNGVRMELALKAAANTLQRIIVLDLTRNTARREDWYKLLSENSTILEPGNEFNLNVFNLTAPPQVSTASITAYKSGLMATFLIHASQMDEHYRIRDHVQALLSSTYGSSGTNTITCNKLLEQLESGTSALRPNSPQESQVNVLINSFKDYSEINAPIPTNINDILSKEGHVWLRHPYQPLSIRMLVVLWFIHELAATGASGNCIIINGLRELVPATRQPNKFQLIVDAILPLLNDLALNNHLFFCSELVASLHASVFLPLQNSVYLKLPSDNEWQAIRSKHAFRLESDKFENLKKLENQAFLVREDRSSVPLVFNIDRSDSARESLSRLLSAGNKQGIEPSASVTNEQGTKKQVVDLFNQTGTMDPRIELPKDVLEATAFLEACRLLDRKKSVESSEIETLLAKLIDPHYNPPVRKVLDWDDPDLAGNKSNQHSRKRETNTLGALEKPVKELTTVLAKSNLFSIQIIEKRYKRMNWSLKQLGTVFYDWHRENSRYLMVNTGNFSLVKASTRIANMIELHETAAAETDTLLINNEQARQDFFYLLRQLLSHDYKQSGNISFQIYAFLHHVSLVLEELSARAELDKAISILEESQEVIQQMLLDSRIQSGYSDPVTVPDLQEDTGQDERIDSHQDGDSYQENDFLEEVVSRNAVKPLFVPGDSKKINQVDQMVLDSLEGNSNDQPDPVSTVDSSKRVTTAIEEVDPLEKYADNLDIIPDFLKDAPEGWPGNINPPLNLEEAVKLTTALDGLFDYFTGKDEE